MSDVPKFVSRELFQSALAEYFHSDRIKLLAFESSNAVPEGDNYTSDLFRTSITYCDENTKTHKQLSVIVKCGNEDGGMKTDIAAALNIFGKEIEMFSRTFPALYEILGERYTLSSKCFYTSLKPHAVIILEDLTTLNYVMLPRHVGFDLEHCLKVIEKMAMMHAASVLMYEKDPSLVEPYAEGLYADKHLIREWVRTGYTALADACSRWPGFEKYGYKLSALKEEAVDRAMAAWKRKVGGFHVLNHGDLWVNNMMFCYESDGRLKDMKFVDFQMNVFSSPVIDLHYFIATSTKLDVKMKNIDLIIDFYYAHLLANLTKLQYSLKKVPTREQFRKEYILRASYGLMGAATVLPFVKATPRKDASFESIIKDESVSGFRYEAYNNERYRKHMEFLLPYYDNFGVLN